VEISLALVDVVKISLALRVMENAISNSSIREIIGIYSNLDDKSLIKNVLNLERSNIHLLLFSTLVKLS
jgi:hypothetical protein